MAADEVSPRAYAPILSSGTVDPAVDHTRITLEANFMHMKSQLADHKLITVSMLFIV